MNLLIFAGTTEGRKFAELIRSFPVRGTICVATGYGRDMLEEFSGRFEIREGRMDAETMCSFMREGDFDCVVDATHPYAVAVSKNIRNASEAVQVRHIRLVRAAGEENGEWRNDADVEVVSVGSASAAAKILDGTGGNVLLTTGSKDLAAFTVIAEFADRLYPRVLPVEDSVRECARLGFRRGHIIAMQGPFSRELNLALMRQFSIAVLVTKDSGVEGGFPEKILAARDAGVRVVVIGRPEREGGLSLGEAVEFVRSYSEAKA